MAQMPVPERMKRMIDPRKDRIKARIFVTREDGITVYDTVQDKTTASVAALVSGVWQASEALVSLVKKNKDIMEFRLGFDTSSQGVYLFPLVIGGKKYFMGAMYENCLNPGPLKRQVALLKEEIDRILGEEEAQKPAQKAKGEAGFLFQDISDEEMDKLFSLGGL